MHKRTAIAAIVVLLPVSCGRPVASLPETDVPIVPRLRSGAAAQEEAKEPSWKTELRGKLRREITLDFDGMPLDEAVAFLQTLTGMTIIIDRYAARIDDKDDEVSLPITESVEDMPLGQALELVLQKGGMICDLADGVVFAGKPSRVAQARRVSDARDLRASREQMPEAERRVRRQLQRKVCFCTPDDPFGDMLDFMQTLTKASIVLDPHVEAHRNVPVRITIMSMPLERALCWTARAAGLEYEVRRDHVFISTAERLNLLRTDNPSVQTESETPIR